MSGLSSDIWAVGGARSHTWALKEEFQEWCLAHLSAFPILGPLFLLPVWLRRSPGEPCCRVMCALRLPCWVLSAGPVEGTAPQRCPG